MVEFVLLVATSTVFFCWYFGVKRAYKKANAHADAYKAELKVKLDEVVSKFEDTQKKQTESIDTWKKACWDAEARNLATSGRLCEVDELLRKTQAEVDKVVNQKKSSEVRTGLIAEQMAPFIGGFPYNPKDAHFLGKPIDFIVFAEDGIHFVEVKSGEAKLTEVQRRIKQQIEDKKVSFETFRINGG